MQKCETAEVWKWMQIIPQFRAQTVAIFGGKGHSDPDPLIVLFYLLIR